MNSITAVFITFGRLELTKRTIESFFATKPVECDHAIIVDNGSDFYTKEYLSQFGTDENISLFLKQTNTGWGDACNIGVKECETEFILLSNNDVEFKPGWYEESMKLYEKYPDIGVLGLWKHPSGHTVLKTLDDLVIKDQMPAVALVLKKSFIEKVGGIPVHGPCLTQGGNGEDVQLCNKSHELNLLVCGPKEDLAIHIPGN